MALPGPGFRNTTGKAGRVDVGAPDAEENNRTKKHEEKNDAEGNVSRTPAGDAGGRRRLREAIRLPRYREEDGRTRTLDNRHKRGGIMHAVNCGSSRTELTQSRRETAIDHSVSTLKSLTEGESLAGGWL